MREGLEREIAGIAALQEPIRRALYLFVVGRGEDVGREEAAAALDISRALAAFHLDKLVEEKLLEADYRRLSGRTGPGAGRPAKVYRRSARQLAVSIPPRRYDLAAHVFASALERSPRKGDDALADAAREVGRAIGAEARDAAGARAGRHALRRAALGVLERHGFEPVRSPRGEIRLRNCPFDALLADHRELVCGMNLSFMQGVLAGLRDTGVRARLEPRPGMCCVVLRGS